MCNLYAMTRKEDDLAALPRAAHQPSASPTDVKPATWHWFAINGDDPPAAVRFSRYLAALPGACEEGCPYENTAQAHDLLPAILAGPPQANKIWHHDLDDVLGPKWVGRTLIEHHVAEACVPDEWLLVEA